MGNRLTALQAYMVLSTATCLYTPMLKQLADELPGATRDIAGAFDSTIKTTRLVNANKARAARRANPTPSGVIGITPDKMNFKQQQVWNLKTIPNRVQHKV